MKRWDKKESLCTVNFMTTVKNSIGGYQKLKQELLYDPAISPQGIYLKEMKTWIQNYIYTTMSTAALFTIKRHGNINSWMDKEVVIHKHTHTPYYSAIKKNEEILPFPTWMDLEAFAKWSNSDREKQILHDLLGGKSKTPLIRDQICGYQRWSAEDDSQKV